MITCSGLKLYLVSPLKSKTLDRSIGVILVENRYGDNWIKSNNDFYGRLAQWQSTTFTPWLSGVQIPHRPPFYRSVAQLG